MLNYLIKNARVISGLLEDSQALNIGIQGDKLAVFSVDETPEAETVIDAKGMILTPGFIDPHASTGFGYFFPNAADHKLFQGITTEIFGNCGTSPAPIGKHLVGTMNKLSEDIGFPFDWQSTEEYFDRIQDKLQFNIATLVGHSTLRAGEMDDWNTVTEEQIETMKTSLAKAMDEGALGFSTG